MLRQWIDRVFKLEEINGGDMCPTYLRRWTLFGWKHWKVYLHHFIGDDWSRDLHDHPKRFVSIGLWGGYIEETPRGRRHYRAPWVRSFPANHIHRIWLPPGGTCWTLVIVGKWERDWGFWHKGHWIHWRRYVGSAEAELSKACGD